MADLDESKVVVTGWREAAYKGKCFTLFDILVLHLDIYSGSHMTRVFQDLS